jgi:hypothetical protein
MASTSPARIDDDLFASAKLAGAVQSRSAAQQVAHWARIGREVEASNSISARAIAEALSGSRPYDDLDAKEQAVVRAEWATRMDDRRASLDLAAAFAAEGRSWVELDEHGDVVERAAGSTVEGRSAPATPARAPRKVAAQAASTPKVTATPTRRKPATAAPVTASKATKASKAKQTAAGQAAVGRRKRGGAAG